MKEELRLGRLVLAPSGDYQYITAVPDQPSHELSRGLIAAWQEFAAQGGPVLGKDVPSRAFRSFLGNIAVVEPVEDGRDLKIRLSGDLISRRFGRNISGACVSELYQKDQADWAIACVTRAIQECRPVVGDSRVLEGKIEVLRTELVFLPMLAADRTTRLAMIAGFYFARPSTA
jgi:hypothetical protein